MTGMFPEIARGRVRGTVARMLFNGLALVSALMLIRLLTAEDFSIVASVTKFVVVASVMVALFLALRLIQQDPTRGAVMFLNRPPIILAGAAPGGFACCAGEGLASQERLS